MNLPNVVLAGGGAGAGAGGAVEFNRTMLVHPAWPEKKTYLNEYLSLKTVYQNLQLINGRFMTISGHFFANKYLSQNFGSNSHF